MQFVLMIFQGTTPLPGSDAWAALPAREQQRIQAGYAEVNGTHGVTPGLPLGAPEHAKTVRVTQGGRQVADGPPAGAGHALGGYLVFEADDLEAALALAARIPAARLGGAVEVRPVVRSW